MSGGANGTAKEAKGTESALRALSAQEANRRCCECGQRGPTYVDVTTGAFVCARCSGLLRGLTPPHRVKSISMATFSDEEIRFIETRGNRRCEEIWMALHEGGGERPPFRDERALRDFLVDKYEKKRYYSEAHTRREPKPAPLPVRSQPSPSRTAAVPPPVPRPAPPATTFRPTPEIPGFHADFSNADIFNSSQLNNNPTFSSPPAAFRPFQSDTRNANVVPSDRYAALADLDFTFRQQSQSRTEIPEERTGFNSSFNPFKVGEVSKNPFRMDIGTPNGNITGMSNPFITGSNAASSPSSKNPFL